MNVENLMISRGVRAGIPHVRPCAGPCERMTRPAWLSLEKAPGTVVRRRGDKCSLCLGPSNGVKKDVIRICAGPCGRMTRHARIPLSAAPNTVGRVGLGKCAQCYVETVKARDRRPQWYTDDQFNDVVFRCGGTCGRITRPHWMNEAEAPGTVCRKRGDRCGACLAAPDAPAPSRPQRRIPKVVRTPDVPPVPEREVADLTAPAAYGLGAFLNRRHARITRPQVDPRVRAQLEKGRGVLV